MRILKLGDINSPHLRRIVTALCAHGFEVQIFSLSAPGENWWGALGVVVHGTGGTRGVGSYLRSVSAVRRVVKSFKPALVHAHYATSYGLLGALAGHHPLVISAWGTDVLLFPRKSPVHRGLLRWTLRRADHLCATSKVLEDALRTLCDVPVTLTPFGVDTELFAPNGPARTFFSPETLVVGTIKTLSTNYGIDTLLRAFAEVLKRLPEPRPGLFIGGDGPQRNALEALAAQLITADNVIFGGAIPFAELPDHHRSIDVFANLSWSESFGVSVLEAAACGRPVVATNVGGLPEVVQDGRTGLLVRPGDVAATTDVLERLLRDAQLRQRLGAGGRAMVVQQYDWKENATRFASLYHSLVP